MTQLFSKGQRYVTSFLPHTISDNIHFLPKEKSEKVAAHKPQTQFGKNRGDMFLHSLDTDVELIGDLAVFQARLAAKQKDTLT